MKLNPIVDSRDVRFILFEVLGVQKLTEYPMYSEFDRETFEDVVDLAETIAVDKVYPANAEGDREHCIFDPGTKEVRIPEAYREGLDAYHEAGFMGLHFKQEAGGMGMPFVLDNVVTDYFSSASCAFGMYPMLSKGALNMYVHFLEEGNLRDTIIEKMLSGEWGGTMCLTEPEAGSDVGALKTKAVINEEGDYSITGQKIFISNGDNNYYKNIIHPVLARIEGDPPGTKGISIFVVPKFSIDEGGSPGSTNDVVCAGIEEKMGIHGSATCTLMFGDDKKCRGVLMGKERQGMKIMFEMMNEARLFVGLQGMAVSSAAYMHAVTYAGSRVQSRNMAGGQDPSPVAIVKHPDIKRMLLSMKSRVEAMRSLTYFCGFLQDLRRAGNDDEKKEAAGLLDFLIPVCKAGNTDQAWEVTADAIQVYGGYGYISEYPVEQYARDAKILSLYEGTNGIQSIDLLMRKLLMNENQYNYSVYKKKITEDIEAAKGIVDEKYISVISRALEKMDEIIKHLGERFGKGDISHLFAHATPLQKAFAILTYGWMHLKGLTRALPERDRVLGDSQPEDLEAFLEENSEAAFYTGRVLSGQFFLGAEIRSFFSLAEYILSGDSSVTEATAPVFTGAIKE